MRVAEGTSAVVTGAAGGIGAAVAQRLLERGASVTLSDLDAERLAATATALEAEHPGRVTHLAGDAADEASLRELVATAEGLAGPVGLFVANAGIFRGFGLEADDEQWQTSWDVNVMAHVRAARLLVPQWLERGEGCFAVTASAAGLLTQLGLPTYAVTKHAAVGFAEWLAATYGDRGVQVAALCPMGVRTPLVEQAEATQDEQARLGMRSVTEAGAVLEPLEVADSLLAAIDEGRFLALPHAEVGTMHARKAADPDRWIAGMQRLRRSLD